MADEALLACSICFDVPTDTIWSCTEGHIVCAQCNERWNRPCSQCRQPVTTRLRALEAVRDALPFACPCGFQGVWSDATAHNRLCECANVSCPCVDCDASVENLAALARHVTTAHAHDAMCVSMATTDDGASVMNVHLVIDGTVSTLVVVPTTVAHAALGVVVHVRCASSTICDIELVCCAHQVGSMTVRFSEDCKADVVRAVEVQNGMRRGERIALASAFEHAANLMSLELRTRAPS